MKEESNLNVQSLDQGHHAFQHRVTVLCTVLRTIRQEDGRPEGWSSQRFATIRDVLTIIQLVNYRYLQKLS